MLETKDSEGLVTAIADFNRPVSHIIVEQVEKEIADFEATLADDEEIGGILANYAGAMIHLRNFNSYGTGLFVFEGYTTDGNRIRLLQHKSQVNILLIAVKPLSKKEPFRFGFTQTEK